MYVNNMCIYVSSIMKVILCLSQMYGKAILSKIKQIENISAVLISDDVFAKSASIDSGIDLICMNPLSNDVLQMSRIAQFDLVIAAMDDTLMNLNISLLYKLVLNTKKSIVLLKSSASLVENYRDFYKVDICVKEESTRIDVVSNWLHLGESFSKVVPIDGLAFYFSSTGCSIGDVPNCFSADLDQDRHINITQSFFLQDKPINEKQVCGILGSDLHSFREAHGKMKNIFKKFIVSAESNEVGVNIAEEFGDVDVISNLKPEASNFNVDRLILSYREKYANIFASLYYKSSCKSAPFAISYNDKEDEILRSNKLARVINVPDTVGAAMANALLFNFSKIGCVPISDNLFCYIFSKRLTAEDLDGVAKIIPKESTIIEYNDSWDCKIIDSVSSLQHYLICFTTKVINFFDAEDEIHGWYSVINI